MQCCATAQGGLDVCRAGTVTQLVDCACLPVCLSNRQQFVLLAAGFGNTHILQFSCVETGS